MDCSIPHLITIDYMVLIVLHAEERAGLTNLQSIGLVVTEIIYVAAAVPMTTAVAHTRIDFVRRQKSPQQTRTTNSKQKASAFRRTERRSGKIRKKSAEKKKEGYHRRTQLTAGG